MDDTISLRLFNDKTSSFCFSTTRSSSSTSVTLFLWSQPSGPQSRCRMTSCPTFFHNEPFHVLLWSLACVKIYFSICEAPCLLRTVDLPLHCTYGISLTYNMTYSRVQYRFRRYYCTKSRVVTVQVLAGLRYCTLWSCMHAALYVV